jgi:hypothetical protein
MLTGFCDFNAEHGRGGDKHKAATGQDTVEAPDQGDRAGVALNQAGFGGIDPRGGGKAQREDLAFGEVLDMGDSDDVPGGELAVVDPDAGITEADDKGVGLGRG